MPLSGENDGRVNPAHSRKMTALFCGCSKGIPITLSFFKKACPDPYQTEVIT